MPQYVFSIAPLDSVLVLSSKALVDSSGLEGDHFEEVTVHFKYLTSQVVDLELDGLLDLLSFLGSEHSPLLHFSLLLQRRKPNTPDLTRALSTSGCSHLHNLGQILLSPVRTLLDARFIFLTFLSLTREGLPGLTCLSRITSLLNLAWL